MKYEIFNEKFETNFENTRKHKETFVRDSAQGHRNKISISAFAPYRSNETPCRKLKQAPTSFIGTCSFSWANNCGARAISDLTSAKLAAFALCSMRARDTAIARCTVVYCRTSSTDAIMSDNRPRSNARRP